MVIILELAEEWECDLLENSPNMLNRWKNHFCQLLNIHYVNDVTQSEIRTAVPIVFEYGALDVEMNINNFKLFESRLLTILRHMIQADDTISISSLVF